MRLEFKMLQEGLEFGDVGGRSGLVHLDIWFQNIDNCFWDLLYVLVAEIDGQFRIDGFNNSLASSKRLLDSLTRRFNGISKDLNGL